jgi:phospholipid/cholesterol/gamma-HCH transport system substrate-binding protein
MTIAYIVYLTITAYTLFLFEIGITTIQRYLPVSSAKQSVIKVGIFTIISLVCLTGVLYWLRGRSLMQGPTHEVYFQDVDGLKIGAPVQLMGLRVGFIEAIEPIVSSNNFKIKVRFRITEKGTPPPKASVVSIEQSGLISEKLLEITPPRLTQVEVNTPIELPLLGTLPSSPSMQHVALKLKTTQGPLTVGAVERIELLPTLSTNQLIKKRTFRRYRLFYRITEPGVLPPEFASYHVQVDKRQKQPYLYLTSSSADWQPPSIDPSTIPSQWFTVEPPLRLKEFLDIQIASAEALKTTNDKLNSLLDEETVQDIQQILTNIKILSKQATKLISTTDSLFQTLNADVNALVTSSYKLTKSLNSLVVHLDGLVGDPKLQQQVRTTIADVQTAVSTLNALLRNDDLNNLLVRSKNTMTELEGLTKDVRQKLKAEKLSQQLEADLTLVGETLTKLNSVLGDVEQVTGADQGDLGVIIQDARVTTQNLKVFSEKLKGRFVLWKLMF